MSALLDLRLAAQGGDPRAQLELGRVLLRQGPEAQQEGMSWIHAACAQNHAEAVLQHAALAVLGLGCTQNIENAYALLSQAADLGSAAARNQLGVLKGADGFNYAAWNGAPKLTKLFDEPVIYTIEDFIPKQVCKWLIVRSRKRLQRTKIFSAQGGGECNASRTNSYAPISALETDVVAHLVKLRIAQLTSVPVAHQDQTNVLCYERGQEYAPHYDFFVGDEVRAFAKEIDQIGQRIGTFLIYLNDDYEGGETEFPALDWRYKGKAGDALLFWNKSAAGAFEQKSIHAGLPVKKGVKWLLSQWMRERPVPIGWYV